MSIEESYMLQAIDLAKKGRGRVAPNPLVGCVIVIDRKIIGEGYHRKFGESHAEVDAINNCTESPHDADLYVTLEPCIMCGGASFWTQIKRIVYGASDEKRGFSNLESSVLHPKTEVTKAIHEEKCSKILQDFFQNKRT